MLEPDGLDRDLEQLVQPLDARAGRGRREQLLLRVDAEVDARRELELELRRVDVRQVDIALGDVGELCEELGRADQVQVVRRLVEIDHRLDDAGRERPAFRQLEQTEALAALDDDVHRPVVERLEHPLHRRARADLVHGAVAGGEHEAEVAAGRHALLDQLEVARLEDVQRNPLGRDEHERQGKETELRHACSLRSPAGTGLARPGPGDCPWDPAAVAGADVSCARNRGRSLGSARWQHAPTAAARAVPATPSSAPAFAP